MNEQAKQSFRFDKRLAHREGWISKEDRQKALDSLPDVSQKATTLEESGTSGGDGAASGPRDASGD